MKQKLIFYTKEILLFIVVMTLFANLLSYYKSQDLNKEPLRVTHFTTLENSIYDIPNNKPVLLHFWATWCSTCQMEADNIERLSKHFNVITVAVKSGDATAVKKYLKEHNYTFKVVNDPKGTLAHTFHVSAFPTTFIYDKNHQLILSDVGYTSTLGLWVRMFLAQF